jgi:hypothetical protein
MHHIDVYVQYNHRLVLLLIVLLMVVVSHIQYDLQMARNNLQLLHVSGRHHFVGLW